MKINILQWIVTVSGKQKIRIILLKNLKQMTDKTVIIITHRPAALDICDKILNFSEKGVCYERNI